MDWGSDTQELEWEQRRVRDSENGSKAEQQQKKVPSKGDKNSAAELSNIWQFWKLLSLSQSLPL